MNFLQDHFFPVRPCTIIKPKCISGRQRKMILFGHVLLQFTLNFLHCVSRYSTSMKLLDVNNLFSEEEFSPCSHVKVYVRIDEIQIDTDFYQLEQGLISRKEGPEV